MIEYIALGLLGLAAGIAAWYLLHEADHREDGHMSQDWLERQKRTDTRAADWRTGPGEGNER